MAAITQKLVLDDVVKYLLHPAFNVDIVSLNNSDVARAAGDGLIGELAFYTGSAWKILDDGDSISAASLICPILWNEKLLAAAAGDEAAIVPKCPILRRGPAIVIKNDIVYDAVEATCDAAMLALGIKTVEETGLEVNYDVI